VHQAYYECYIAVRDQAEITAAGHLTNQEKEASLRRRAEAEAAKHKEQADSWKERANKATAAASEKPRFSYGNSDRHIERLEVRSIPIFSVVFSHRNEFTKIDVDM
jgi:hypothetical protein